MLERICQFCRNRLTATIVLTFVIESVTLFFRFGLGLKSTEHTASTVGQLTMGIRFHHGYAGVILLILLLISRVRRHRAADVIFVVGMSLFVSDVIHHTLLYLITGSADFDLVYPGMFK
ncbi:MAG: hypothetical protein CVV42_01535 [Candidatus Riflebacteria bacterium HGW-Riflebacteria-2]|jgi:hypothetical protein|nr:MAG: hypothetical protein CVV42_01535 [Candidatus Riflebacteria bacterium HGW-Riflebacteria-2]